MIKARLTQAVALLSLTKVSKSSAVMNFHYRECQPANFILSDGVNEVLHQKSKLLLKKKIEFGFANFLCKSLVPKK